MFIAKSLDSELDNYDAGANTQDEVVRLFLVLNGDNIRKILRGSNLGENVLPVLF